VSHTVKTLGFTVETPVGTPGMNLNKLMHLFGHIDRNAEALVADGLSLNDVMETCAKLRHEDVFTFPDGTEVGFGDIRDEDESIPAFKLAILGDTRDAGESLELVRGANVLVHEATNMVHAPPGRSAQAPSPTWLGKSRKKLTLPVYIRGHSTPEMAGEFAKEAEVGSLVLNHFSQAILETQLPGVLKEAVQASGLTRGSVLCAKDNMLVEIKIAKRGPRASGLGRYYDVRDVAEEQKLGKKQTAWVGGAPKDRALVKSVKAFRKQVERKMDDLRWRRLEEQGEKQGQRRMRRQQRRAQRRA
jgi:ribonuclease Z